VGFHFEDEVIISGEANHPGVIHKNGETEVTVPFSIRIRWVAPLM